MKASVVVPVFNKAPFLEECFASILGQSEGDIEVIAVDDASTDDSLQRLQAMREPRLRIIAMERNAGPGLAAQRGMDEARAPVIIRADADDVMHPDRVAAQLAHLASDATLGAVGGQLDLLGRSGERWLKPLDHEDLRAELLFGPALFQPAMALRKEVLVQHGIRYRPEWPRFGEDWLLQLELSRVTRLANLERSLVHYRVGPQNTAHGRDRYADHLALFAEAFTFFGLPADPAELRTHALAIRLFKQPPTAATLRDFDAWLRKLEAMDRERAIFAPGRLRHRLDQAWDDLFPRMPEFGPGVLAAYLWQRPRWDARRLRYLGGVLWSLLRGRGVPRVRADR